MHSKIRRKRSAAPRGALTLMDVVVIGILLALLVVAARQDFPGLDGRATPVATPAPQQAASE